MTLYRKFGQGLAILCCLAMFVMAVALVISGGVSNVDEKSGDVIYFYERANFQGAMFVALSFLISVVANFVAKDYPQIASVLSALPLAITFYEMAVENLHFVLAAVLLLLALIHLVSNIIAWWDLMQWKNAHRSAAAEETPAEVKTK